MACEAISMLMEPVYSFNRYGRASDIRYGSFEVDERGGVEALWTKRQER
jgi:hypothetical protein